MWDVAFSSTVEAWETWQVKAACRGPESALFFPPAWTERRDERGAREARAKAICESCGVRRACLAFAVAIREQHGIWGGLNEAERRHLAATEQGPSAPRRTERKEPVPAGAGGARRKGF